MARRPVLTPLGTRPYVHEVSTEFTLHPGLSLKQKQRSTDSLHRSFLAAHPGARMPEVSGRSPLILGAELSAFRLEPRTFLYDWLYVGALAGRPGLIDEVESYTAFTDIEFSPKRSINCRARSVSLFQGLRVVGVAGRALESADDFLQVCKRVGRIVGKRFIKVIVIFFFQFAFRPLPQSACTVYLFGFIFAAGFFSLVVIFFLNVMKVNGEGDVIRIALNQFFNLPAARIFRTFAV